MSLAIAIIFPNPFPAGGVLRADGLAPADRRLPHANGQVLRRNPGRTYFGESLGSLITVRRRVGTGSDHDDTSDRCASSPKTASRCGCIGTSTLWRKFATNTAVSCQPCMRTAISRLRSRPGRGLRRYREAAVATGTAALLRKAAWSSILGEFRRVRTQS
jgi:hypothetical protein